MLWCIQRPLLKVIFTDLILNPLKTIRLSLQLELKLLFPRVVL